jgi:hypothetical protein
MTNDNGPNWLFGDDTDTDDKALGSSDDNDGDETEDGLAFGGKTGSESGENDESDTAGFAFSDTDDESVSSPRTRDEYLTTPQAERPPERARSPQTSRGVDDHGDARTHRHAGGGPSRDTPTDGGSRYSATDADETPGELSETTDGDSTDEAPSDAPDGVLGLDDDASFVEGITLDEPLRRTCWYVVDCLLRDAVTQASTRGSRPEVTLDVLGVAETLRYYQAVAPLAINGPERRAALDHVTAVFEHSDADRVEVPPPARFDETYDLTATPARFEVPASVADTLQDHLQDQELQAAFPAAQGGELPPPYEGLRDAFSDGPGDAPDRIVYPDGRLVSHQVLPGPKQILARAIGTGLVVIDCRRQLPAPEHARTTPYEQSFILTNRGSHL